MSHRTSYQIEHQSGSLATLVDYEFTYGGANRITSESRGTYLKNYDYDRTSQVVDDGLSSYSYDASGNRTMAGYAVGSNNRTSTDGTWDYTYNDEGSIVKKENISTGLTWTYGFSHRNQMIWAEERATDGGTLLTRVDYTIDAFGNLIQQETDTGSVVTERFAFEIVATSPGITHSVLQHWADLDGSNAIITRYLDGLARSDGTDLEWLLTDRLGSITEILYDTGAIVKELEWDAFGNIVSQSGSAALGNIGFTGMYFDTATGLGFTKYRPYNFDLGQFIGEDPIGFDAGDANLLRYVGINGLNGKDLSGLQLPTIPIPGRLDSIEKQFKGVSASAKNNFEAFIPVVDAYAELLKVYNRDGITEAEQKKLNVQVLRFTGKHSRNNLFDNDSIKPIPKAKEITPDKSVPVNGIPYTIRVSKTTVNVIIYLAKNTANQNPLNKRYTFYCHSYSLGIGGPSKITKTNYLIVGGESDLRNTNNVARNIFQNNSIFRVVSFLPQTVISGGKVEALLPDDIVVIWQHRRGHLGLNSQLFY
ncbi:MAG: RHS repeat-associated core domain-containing protein [Zavarzinella sp.]